MKIVSSRAALAALLGCALVVGARAPSANAATYQCPTPAASFDRVYELSTALGCAYGSGNLENLSVTTGVTVTAYQDTYPSPPAPTTGVYPIPSGANLLGTFDPAANTQTGTLVTFSGSASGTITFSNLFNFLNVLVAIQDGNQSPRWAVFNVGALIAGTVLNWDYLTCNDGVASCGLASSPASGLIVWGDSSAVNPVNAVPLPAAVWLMGSILGGGAGFGAWRKRKERAQRA
jgi:hypothetical protein